jgi:hypothetical protein
MEQLTLAGRWPADPPEPPENGAVSRFRSDNDPHNLRWGADKGVGDEF